MILPDHVKSKIADAKERKRHGLTAREAGEKYWLALERTEQKHFRNYLELHKIAYYQAGTHKRTTANLGVPDFLIPCYRLAIEFKRPPNKLTSEQETWRARHEARGGIYRVVEVYQQAVEIMKALER